MRDEYPHLLGIDNADVRDSIELATRFIFRLLEEGNVKLKFRDDVKMKIAYHTPCHMEKARLGVLFHRFVAQYSQYKPYRAQFPMLRNCGYIRL